MNKYEKDDEIVIVKHVIDENLGIGFIKYGCESKGIMKVITECKGGYYIFVNKVNGKWLVNESTRSLIW